MRAFWPGNRKKQISAPYPVFTTTKFLLHTLFLYYKQNIKENLPKKKMATRQII
jgi:hypothetical protein